VLLCHRPRLSRTLVELEIWQKNSDLLSRTISFRYELSKIKKKDPRFGLYFLCNKKGNNAYENEEADSIQTDHRLADFLVLGKTAHTGWFLPSRFSVFFIY
jgi:hypothetical protein